MKKCIKISVSLLVVMFVFSCSNTSKKENRIASAKERSNLSAKDILGNPNYLAMSYGGYRYVNHDIEPTLDELKEDMKILFAMGIKIVRTYKLQLPQAENLLKAISDLKKDDPNFEMYVMLGAWISCKNAWTDKARIHNEESEANAFQIEKAVKLANHYPDIIKIIAVGNESMVKWQENYYVHPAVILKWVNHLQELKKSGKLSKNLWITSSDNFASWGGGEEEYHVEDLNKLIDAVDFISMHTYPMHDTHYNPDFWGLRDHEAQLPDLEKIDVAMNRAIQHAMLQYNKVANYLKSLGVNKPIHIGETGWASVSNGHYGPKGSKATDEFKEGLYYKLIRDWTNSAGISCFYFEAFDEHWKDAQNKNGSENHFGLFSIEGQAKYGLWELVDNEVFNGLTRNGQLITKTYNGDKSAMMTDLLIPPLQSEMGLLEITTINDVRKLGDQITEKKYIVIQDTLLNAKESTYPSAKLKLNAWEGSCNIKISNETEINVTTGTGSWWGSALEIQGGIGENFSNFSNGYLHFDMKGNTKSSFILGFQTGSFTKGNQIDNYITFGESEAYILNDTWTSYSIPMSRLIKEGDLTAVSSLLFFRGKENFDGKEIYIKNIVYSRK